MQVKKGAGGTLIAVGAVLMVVSAGPLAWGFGLVVAAVLAAVGVGLVTDHERPVQLLSSRPYDRARDGA